MPRRAYSSEYRAILTWFGQQGVNLKPAKAYRMGLTERSDELMQLQATLFSTHDSRNIVCGTVLVMQHLEALGCMMILKCDNTV